MDTIHLGIVSKGRQTMKCPFLHIDDEQQAMKDGTILESTVWCDGIHHYRAFAAAIYGGKLMRGWFEKCPHYDYNEEVRRIREERGW